MNPKIVAIIQARMTSSRLYGKVLLPLGPCSKPTLWWMLNRVILSESIDKAVIATVLNNSTQAIRKAFPKCTYSWAGDENDVMGRVLWVAKKTNADIIVDLTGDCPLVDHWHIDYLIQKMIDGKYDYASNCVYRDFPDGLDIQVYWTKTLQKCKKLFNPKQHCGWNITQHPEIFNLFHYKASKTMHWPELGLTLDTPEDYDFLQFIFGKYGHNLNFHVEEVVKFLRKNLQYITNTNVRRKIPEEG